jgi:hypothetical protein
MKKPEINICGLNMAGNNSIGVVGLSVALPTITPSADDEHASKYDAVLEDK